AFRPLSKRQADGSGSEGCARCYRGGGARDSQEPALPRRQFAIRRAAALSERVRRASMKLWAMKGRDGKLHPVALRTRYEVQKWAGQRFMSADDYRQRAPDWSAVWKRVRQNHPSFRIVRVTVSEKASL